MFDAVGAFTKQFTPVDGGYLYYPSGKSGGKLVTSQEYELLRTDWERVAGKAGRWKTVGAIFLAIIVWMIVSETLALPEWSQGLFVGCCGIALSAWLLRASFSPRRLVRNRPEIAPPRARSQARKEARALLTWRFIGIGLVLSGVVFASMLTYPERSLNWWAWAIGSGGMFVAYIWILVAKLRDRRSQR